MKFNKIFFGIWIFIFALFAFWQFNDPDPEVWVSIYENSVYGRVQRDFWTINYPCSDASCFVESLEEIGDNFRKINSPIEIALITYFP